MAQTHQSAKPLASVREETRLEEGSELVFAAADAKLEGSVEGIGTEIEDDTRSDALERQMIQG